MNEDLIKKINQYETKGDFTHAPVSNEMIGLVEDELNVTIPEDYKAFLKIYGHGGIGGIEVFGVGKNGIAVFEKQTLKYRSYGLPLNMVVLENCDEWLYCLNCANGTVESWSMADQKLIEEYDSFDAYLSDRLDNIIENM